MRWTQIYRENGSHRLSLRKEALIIIRQFFFRQLSRILQFVSSFGLAAEEDLNIEHVNVNAAFLNENLEEEVYMEQLECFFFSKEEMNVEYMLPNKKGALHR